MAGNGRSTESISEIYIDPQPSGLRAVYLVETRSTEEARRIADLFGELESRFQIKQLSRGRLVSYAVQAHHSDAVALDEVENLLKSAYSFVVTQRSFDELIYRIVRELCRDTGSKLLPVSRCNICGKIEPFPTTVVNMSDGEGDVLISRVYCGGCTAAAVAPNSKQFVRSLLAADRRDFRAIERAELIKRPSRRRPLRFRIKTADPSLSG
mgnify:CR=1 FL=1